MPWLLNRAVKINQRGCGSASSRAAPVRVVSNADLAGDASVVIVVEPMAHAYGTSSTPAGPKVVIRLVPDANAIEALGPDMTDLTAWVPAYQSGVRQAPDAAQRIRACTTAM